VGQERRARIVASRPPTTTDVVVPPTFIPMRLGPRCTRSTCLERVLFLALESAHVRCGCAGYRKIEFDLQSEVDG
jgi:hypothetical protein